MPSQSTPNTRERLGRAIHSLHGLSCGDAFGERFFLHPEVAQSLIAQRAVPSPPWRYTDDTAMAVPLVESLEEFDEGREKRLAATFSRHYLSPPHPGLPTAMPAPLP